MLVYLTIAFHISQTYQFNHQIASVAILKTGEFGELRIWNVCTFDHPITKNAINCNFNRKILTWGSALGALNEYNLSL